MESSGFRRGVRCTEACGRSRIAELATSGYDSTLSWNVDGKRNARETTRNFSGVLEKIQTIWFAIIIIIINWYLIVFI